MSYALHGSVINDNSISANLANEAFLGWDCSISNAGDKIVVAALEEHNGSKGRGRLFTYKYSDGSWVAYGSNNEMRGPEDSVGNNDQCLTHSVRMNGDGTVFVSGHPLHDRGTVQSGVNDREGAVMIKQYNSESNAWEARGPDILTTLPILEDDNNDSKTIDRFGEMVDISNDGSVMIIGARYSEASGGSNRGAVFTYKYKIPSADEWSATSNLVFKDGDLIQTSDKYYWVLIGSGSTNATSGGQTAPAGVSLIGEGDSDLLGSAVSISYDGTRIAVGIVGEDEGGSNRGMVRLYDYNSGSDKWEQIAQDISGDANNNTIGYRIALNKSSDSSVDGSRVAFSSRGGGYAKVYELNDATPPQWVMMGTNDVWDSGNTERGKFAISSNQDYHNNRFVSLNDDGDIVAIGHSHDNTVNVYKWDGSSNWALVGQQLNASNYGSISAGDGFGASGQLNSDGSRLVVGSIFADVGGTDVGQAAVYYNSSLVESSPGYFQISGSGYLINTGNGSLTIN